MSRARGQMTREDAMAILNVEPMAGPDSLPDIVDLEKVRGVAFGDGCFGVDLGALCQENQRAGTSKPRGFVYDGCLRSSSRLWRVWRV